MKRRRRILTFLIILLSAFFIGTVKAADNWDVNITKNGSSDVMWSWWNTPLAVTYNGNIYFGFTTKQGYKGIGKYDPNTQKYSQTYIAKTDQIDDHDTASVYVLKDGRIAAIYSGGHNLDSKIHIRISTKPGDISSFGKEIELSSYGKTTYSQVLYSNGTYFLFYRSNTKSWMMKTSTDFENWSNETKIVYSRYDYNEEFKDQSVQYYVLFKETTDPNIIRMLMYSNPLYPDSHIRMGFINTSTGEIYNSDCSTVIGDLSKLGKEGLQSKKFNIVLKASNTVTNRLFDALKTDPKETVFAYMKQSGTAYPTLNESTQKWDIKRHNMGETGDYYIYKNGSSKKIVSNSYRFWSKYFGGISFIDSKRIIVAYGDYDPNSNSGTDYLKIFKYKDSFDTYEPTVLVDKTNFSYSNWKSPTKIEGFATRIMRPIVDTSGTYTLWIKGDYNIVSYGGYSTNVNVVQVNGLKETTSGIESAIKLNGIKFASKSYEVAKGKSKTIHPTAVPTTAKLGTVTYSTSNKSIATVEKNTGKVTGVSIGSTKITAKDNNGYKAEYTINVKKASDISSTSMSFDYSEQTMVKGNSGKLSLNVKPTKSDPGKVTYKSSNSSIVEITKGAAASISSGKFKAKKPGTAVITATSSKGLKASISIQVVELKFKKQSIRLEKVGDKATLQLEQGVKGNVTYAATDNSIVSVSKKGEVTAKKVGSTTVLAYLDVNDSVKSSIKVYVGDKATEIKSESTSYSMKIGDTKQLKVTFKPNNVSNDNISYRSLNSSIAKVTSKGLVTAVKVGTTTIVMNTRDGSRRTAYAIITVSKDGTKKTSDASINKEVNITLNKKVVSLSVGKSETVSIKENKNKIPSSQLEWYSPNNKIAKVNKNGKITAVSSGKTPIYLMYNGGNTKNGVKKIAAIVRVDVNVVQVTNVNLKEKKKTIKVGETSTITISSIKPTNATNKKLKWTSSNTNVVTVNQSGKIKGLKKGTAVIYAVAVDSSRVSGTCVVTVSKDGTTTSTKTKTSKNTKTTTTKGKTVKATSIKVSPASVQIGKGQSTTLKVSFAPGNVTSKKVTWTSSNTSIATVDDKGKVTGKKKGTVTITATTKDGSNKSAKTTVKVTNKIKVTSISIDKKISLKAGKSKTLSVLYTPTNADTKKVTWTSSNKSVAVVSTKGVVKAKAAGTAIITAKTKDGSNKTAKCTVKVTGKSSTSGINSNKYKKEHTGDEIITKRIFIGDSRTVGMQSAVKSTTSDIWSAKTGKGFEWMKSTGVPNVESKIGKATAVIILMGVNDYANNNAATTYANYINSKATTWVKKGAKVYYVSVNAVDDSRSSVAKNHSINAFNVSIKSKLSKNVTYIDTYNNIDWTKTKFDGAGLHYDAATYKLIYNYILKKVYNTKVNTKTKTVKVTKVTITGSNNVTVGNLLN